jgi:acyl carrier protein phosphodiesterase
MNHLAHLLLSGDNPAWITGNFITDFLKPAEQRSMPPDIRQGIQVHLFIDKTIDQHPVYKKSIDLIRQTQQKYAPVVADIYFDYLLYNQWERYSLVPANEFKKKVYDILLRTLPSLTPAGVRVRIESMVGRDFLSAYSTVDFMEGTFRMLVKRVHFNNRLSEAADDFKHYLPVLSEHFDQVFPEMVEACLKFRLNLQN